MYRRILVPVDGSPTAVHGLAEAIKLGQLTGARLRLIHVIDALSFGLSAGEGMGYTGDILDVLRKAAVDLLSRAETQVRASGLAVDSVLNENFAGRVCDLIVAEADSWGADIIVLGTHGRRGIGRLFMGSDAENIVRSSSIPVLLLRTNATTLTPDH